MTVRVNKSSFNIREKLSELGRKFGLKGSELVAAETVQEAREIVSAGRKNLIINGDIQVSQRYGQTATTTGSGTYVIDRFRHENGNAGSTTCQRVVDAPPGFYTSMKITVTGTDTSIAANDYSYVRHIIEGANINHLNWGSSNAKTVTLSFWVKSSIIGPHAGAFWNANFDRSFPFDYIINSANSWEHKSITVPGCPDGTWETGFGRGINVAWTQLSGSTYTGTPNQWNSAGDIASENLVNLLATSGATWYITGIQLEIGSNATEFENRPYAEEFRLCQRYFYKKVEPVWGYNIGTNNNYYRAPIDFPVIMRTTPTMSAISVDLGGASAYGFQFSGVSGATYYWNSTTAHAKINSLSADAEL